MSTRARIGIIGGGLMGREVASALGRWFVLDSFPVKAELTAVCDVAEKQREWFRQVPTVRADYRRLSRVAGAAPRWMLFMSPFHTICISRSISMC